MEAGAAYRTAEIETEAVHACPPERVTGRAFLLGLASIVGMCVFAEHYGRGLVRVFMPTTCLLVLVFWTFLNILLKFANPRWALSRTEVLTIFGMTWLVGTLPGIGVVGSLFRQIAAPSYFSTPEDRLWEVVGPYIPMHLFFEERHPAVEGYYLGLRPGESIPWQAWVRPVSWWFSGTVSLVMAGFFASVLFYRQWSDHERLNFPLSRFPADLLETSEGNRVPDALRTRAFWAGFAVVGSILFWNIAGYFILDMPRITIFDSAGKAIELGNYFPPFHTFVSPVFIGLAYLCPLNILFSFWVFYVLRLLKLGMMNRIGFTVGLAGQSIGPFEIVMLEGHGALTFLVAWSVWVARGHLKASFRKAFRQPEQDDGVPVRYRTAWLGFLWASCFLFGWLVSAGFSPQFAVIQLMLYFVVYFGLAKYAAATGFVWLRTPGRTGWKILRSIAGSRPLSPRDLVGLVVGDASGLASGFARPLAIPAIVHVFRMIGKALQRRPLVWGLLPVALLVGYIVQVSTHMHLSYTQGAVNVGGTTISHQLLSLVGDIEATSPPGFDPQKLGVWVFGALEAALLSFLGSRFTGWPIHPIALAFPNVLGFNVFLVWLAKSIIIRFGGVALYERSKPFFYALIVAYLVALSVSTIVDIIWFPTIKGYGTAHSFR